MSTTEPAKPPRRRRRSRFATAPAQDPVVNAPSSNDPPPPNAAAPNLSPAAAFANITVSFKAPVPVAKRRRTRLQPSNASSSLFAGGETSDAESSEGKRPLQPKPPLPPTDRDKQNLLHIANAKPTKSLTDPDPLESYMQQMAQVTPATTTKSERNAGHDGDASSSERESSDEDDRKRRSIARSKPRKQMYEKVDHSRIDYPPFQKELYIEVPELSKLTHAQVAALRRKMGSIRIRGKRCPRPILEWAQAGLSTAILGILQRAGYEKPTPIQAQAIPCVMSGRDIIGVARTGSGKTLAFLLPVLRHIALQPRAVTGEGPTALIIAPTRELAIQIYGEARKFSKAVQVKCVCAYGGSGVKDQIAELKRGADIVICTPGRMIDLLAMNSGRITNLRRVTFVVLDEADRMFDMGFEPQLTRIVENIRPDRQTVMFSATFPVQVEKLARKVLKQPVEIMVGGNSVAAATIDQHVEVRSEDSKFLRLLELLGHWYEKGSTLVFVDRQDNADRIFRDLSKARYRCLSLHGGMDQADRDSAIVDFKNGDIKVLVATSVAARGLDVKNLTLVVNFDVPTHYEDYVHRVGRTGRAGRAGTAYTFITPEQEAFAPDLVKALELSARAVAEQEAPEGDKEIGQKAGDEAAEAAVPDKLRKLANAFEIKRKAGIVKYGASSGYGGRGFSFEDNEEYDAAKSALRKMQAKQYGLEDDVEDEDEDAGRDNGGERKTKEEDGGDEEEDDNDDDIVEISVAPKASGLVKEGGTGDKRIGSGGKRELSSVEIEVMLAEAVRKAEEEADRKKMGDVARRATIAKAKATVLSIASLQSKKGKTGVRAGGGGGTEGAKGAEVSKAAAAAAMINAKLGAGAGAGAGAASGGGEGQEGETRFAAELEINDYPQHARWQVTRKGSLSDVEEFTGCVITTRGNYYAPGRNPPAGERKLHFLIEGPSRRAVKTARRDIKQKLDEAASVSRPADTQYSKYSVV